MDVIRKHMKILGNVQGVGFRYRASHSASMYGLSGWVRNDYDGSVEMEVQGTQEQINLMLDLIKKGHFIQIDNIIEKTIALRDDDNGFNILD